MGRITMKKRQIDHSGEKHFDWEIIEIDDTTSVVGNYYICKCKCGHIKSVLYSNKKARKSKCCKKCSINTGRFKKTPTDIYLNQVKHRIKKI